ncbi:hypothetical protein MBLNU230_g3912t1 [Neophaeotheca triangularis]
MTLFVLTETSAGYALLKAKDKKLLKRDDLAKEAETAEGLMGMLKLKKFRKFESASAALEEAAALTEGKVSSMLSNMLQDIKEEKKCSLAVADPKLGNAITKIPGLEISPISDSTTADLYRGIREHIQSLIPALAPEEVGTMSLGLSHSLSRHKLKFSPDKVDTMIIQAVSILDDLDKELNTYAMRVKEWYGWHFPEMARIINDNLAYSRVILKMGMRSNCATTDLTEILPEEIEGAVKAAAEVSMGTEIAEQDLEQIFHLAENVVGLTEYRSELSSYLTTRMQAIAPNLTTLVGDLVGARLIAHAGSLMNLAKSPASTVQILGAEKALFRALKTKHDTPKYGLIYHASLIGQATGKNKGKIARMLATKATLGLRVDALSDWGTAGKNEGQEPTEEEKNEVGVHGRNLVERRLRALEGKPLKSSGTAIGPGGQRQQAQPAKFDLKEARKYNPDADGISADAPAAVAPALTNGETKKSESKKRKMIEEVEEEAGAGAGVDDSDEGDGKLLTDTKMNGTAERADADSEKAAKKEEKAKRKAEKAAKKAAKKEGKGEEQSSKKRKVESDSESEEESKKSKKKSKKSKA